jgi:hypothetical protein
MQEPPQPQQNDQVATLSKPQTVSKGRRSAFGISHIIDAAALISLTVGIMYFLGYLYYSSYYSYFGVDLSLFPRASADYIITAWDSLFWVIFVLLLVILFRDFFAYVLPSGWIARLSASMPSFLPSFGLFCSVLIFILAAERMQKRGILDAKTTANEKRQIRIETINNLKLPEEIYLLSYSQGKYLLYYFPSPYAPLSTIIVNDSSVTKIEFLQRQEHSKAAH